MQNLVPADTNNPVYQKSSYYTELLGDDALIATAVGGGIKMFSKAASYCVAELGSIFGSMSSKAARGSFVEPIAVKELSKSAFNIANNNGRNACFLNNNLCRNAEELQKGVISFEKQITLHKRKISHSTEHIKNWYELDPRQRQALINQKWPSDIQRLTE